MSAESGQPFKSDVIHLPEKGERTNPGSELVATSRVTNNSLLAICDTNRQVTIESLKKLEMVTVITKEKKSLNVTG